jgi:hypothetical protein
MNILLFRKILLLSLILSLTAVVCEGRSLSLSTTPGPLKSVAEMPQKKKKGKVARPKSARKVQKEADKKDKKKREDSKKAVNEFQKHTLEIQSPDVRERIKQNRKNSDTNYKAKKKNNSSRTKKAGRKYK